MQGFNRVSLNGETIRILIEAEMSKHPECQSCRGWSVQACEADQTGCNWEFDTGSSNVMGSGCFAKIASYITFLKENFRLDDSAPV